MFENFDTFKIKRDLFFPSKYNLDALKKANSYLSENNYYLLRDKINNVPVNFINCDLRRLNYFFDGKYDYIILSNILQYLRCFNEENVLLRLRLFLLMLEKNLNDNGEIGVCYLYNKDKKELISKLKKLKEVIE